MRKNTLSAMSVLALAAAFSGPASAGYMIIDITDNGSATTVTCSTLNLATQAACITAGFEFGGTMALPDFNEVSYNGFIGNYRAAFTNTTTNNPGTTADATLSLSFLDVRNVGSAGTLTYNVYAFGFTLPAGPDLTLFASQGVSANTLTGTGPASFTSNYGVNTTNVTPNFVNAGPDTNVSYTYNQALQVNPWSDAKNLPGVNFTRGALPFSMADQMTFNLAAAGNPGTGNGVNGASNMVVRNRIPEPMTTALVGMGLFGAAFFSRRRKAAKV